MKKITGFGKQAAYKLVITTAMTDSWTLKITANSNKQASQNAQAILLLVCNPDNQTCKTKMGKLGFDESAIDAVVEMGQELASFADKVPKLAKAQSMALAMGWRTKDKIDEIAAQIQGHHYSATLYAPTGQGLQDFTNFVAAMEIDKWSAC